MDLSAVLRCDADEDLHQRGLAGAVLPDKSVDLTLVQVEIHLPQGVDPGKALVDFPHCEDLAAH